MSESKLPKLAWWEYLVVTAVLLATCLCIYVFRLFDIDPGFDFLRWVSAFMELVIGPLCVAGGALYAALTIAALSEKDRKL